MNPLKVAEKIKAVFSILRPFFFAIVGGFVVSMVSRCSKQEPVNLIVTNQAYETQLLSFQKRQDSILNALPDINKSLRYLSERYPDGKESKPNR